eukprot:364604-Chlamydomonas_euryale.AAC.1
MRLVAGPPPPAARGVMRLGHGPPLPARPVTSTPPPSVAFALTSSFPSSVLWPSPRPERLAMRRALDGLSSASVLPPAAALVDASPPRDAAA